MLDNSRNEYIRNARQGGSNCGVNTIMSLETLTKELLNELEGHQLRLEIILTKTYYQGRADGHEVATNSAIAIIGSDDPVGEALRTYFPDGNVHQLEKK